MAGLHPHHGFHEDALRHDLLGHERAQRHDLVDLRDGVAGGHAHNRVEVARRVPPTPSITSWRRPAASSVP
ncbi:hypothetical protein G6F35_018513 [Rhizopus arrhizus]|nr:hypothetical protein G6F35_018513 [Rhizopus arrhizus]